MLKFASLQVSHPDMHPHSTTAKIFIFTPKSSVKELTSAMVGLQRAGWGMSGNFMHLPVILLEMKRETFNINNNDLLEDTHYKTVPSLH